MYADRRVRTTPEPSHSLRGLGLGESYVQRARCEDMDHETTKEHYALHVEMLYDPSLELEGRHRLKDLA